MNSDNTPALRPGWGHAQALVNLQIPAPLEDWESVRDRLAIAQTTVTYGWSIDEERFDVLRDIFTDDMVFRGGVVDAEPFDTMSGDVYVPWLIDFMGPRKDAMRHSFSNFTVTEQTTETATALSYMTLLSSTLEESKILATAFYVWTMAKVSGRWKIRAMYTGFDRQF